MKGLLLIAMLAVTGCTAAGQAALNKGVEDVKQVKDTEARLAVQAPCVIGIGAYNRELNEVEQRAVMALCGGSIEGPVTREDIERLAQ